MYVILNVTDSKIALDGFVLSKERAQQMLILLRAEYPTSKFKIVYLMVEGD